MKMAPGVFWGVVLIIIGAAVIIRVVFNIQLPVVRIVIALIFIFLGIKILIGPNFRHKPFFTESNDVVFSERDYERVNHLKREYNVVFGKANYDFSDISLPNNETYRLSFNVVFGGANLILPDSIPIKIKADAVFSGLKMPDGSTGVFGTSYYYSPNFSENDPYLYIKLDAVFSGIEINY